METMHQVLKNCGNFSANVLPGMIAYGRESEKGRGKLDANIDLPKGDGYATKEADIQIGGFLQRLCAQEAVKMGTHFSAMDVNEKQKLALKLCSEHIREHGGAGPEYYKHWMKRAQSFAKHKKIDLPPKGDRETEYDYFRRVRRWTQDRAEKWPELREAVGTHLVFSPDPKSWVQLRAAGIDERDFLKMVLSKTMKDFSDWRRDLHGPGHSLGWVAGSHVEADGADRHPHIHVVVLKRDEAGKEVDWSVSSLKGRKGREDEPDPLKSIKGFFKKNVEKEFERATGHSLHASPPPPKKESGIRPKMKGFSEGLRATHKAMKPFFPKVRTSTQLGTMLRIIGTVQYRQKYFQKDLRQPDFSHFREKVAEYKQSNHNQPGD